MGSGQEQSKDSKGAESRPAALGYVCIRPGVGRETRVCSSIVEFGATSVRPAGRAFGIGSHVA